MAITGITTTTMETKVDKKSPTAVVTALTIDWTGSTEDQLKALAEKQIKVYLQAKFRAAATADKAEDRKPIPKSHTVKVIEVASGRSGMTTDQMLESLAALAKTDPKFKAQMDKVLGIQK